MVMGGRRVLQLPHVADSPLCDGASIPGLEPTRSVLHDAHRMDEALHRDAVAARSEVQAGLLRAASFRARLLRVPFVDRDAWVNACLGFDEVLDDAPSLPADAVPYLPAGVAEILAAVDGAPITADDHFVDLGSGAGRVVTLVQLLTQARCVGLELQPALVSAARARSAALGLAVEFENVDASTHTLEGSVFFLYSPFTGATLERTLASLHALARRRTITLCTVGMPDFTLPWLHKRESPSVELGLWRSTSS